MTVFRETTAPYQKHSETSKEAAELLNPENLRNDIKLKIDSRGDFGFTGDELSSLLKIVPGTVSARLIELERKGLIVRTTKTRLTRFNRRACVYVSSKFINDITQQKVVSKNPEKQLAKMLYELMRVSPEGTGVIHLSPLDVALVEDIARKLKLKKVNHDQSYYTT